MFDDFDSDVERFLSEGRREVGEYLQDLGDRAAEQNRRDGDYTDRTGNLRASNFADGNEEGMVLGNTAEYASYVESKGYNVIDSGVKMIMEELG